MAKTVCGFRDRVLVLLLVLLPPIFTAAHASDSAIGLGDYLFAMGSHDAAITEYKRYLFFHPDSSDHAETYRKIGLAYRGDGFWIDATDAFRKAIQYAPDDAQADIRLDLAVILIAGGELNLALLECLKAQSQAETEQALRRAQFLRGVAHLYLHHWEQAQQAFREYYGETPASQAKIINTQLKAAMQLPQKSERTAALFSTLLPGAGQIYAGDWKNGLNAFALNAAILFLTVEQALERQFDNAALLGFLLFQRYYGGNRYRASEIAREANRQAQHDTLQRLLHTLNQPGSAQQ